jgi:predicted amidohydrolase
LLRARAIENQSFVIGVNRIGNDTKCEYPGGSAIIDPYGRTIANTFDYQETTAAAEINMNELEAFRQKFPVLNDADSFELSK